MIPISVDLDLFAGGVSAAIGFCEFDLYKEDVELIQHLDRIKNSLNQIATASGILFGLLLPISISVNTQIPNYVFAILFLIAHGLIFLAFIFSQILPLFVDMEFKIEEPFPNATLAKILNTSERNIVDFKHTGVFADAETRKITKEHQEAMEALLKNMEFFEKATDECLAVHERLLSTYNKSVFLQAASRNVLAFGFFALGFVAFGLVIEQNLLAIAIICLSLLLVIILYLFKAKKIREYIADRRGISSGFLSAMKNMFKEIRDGQEKAPA